MKLEACKPPLWALNGHSQTLWGHFLPSPKLRSKGKKFTLHLDDGDQLIGFYQEGKSNVVVSIFHGLAGSTDSSYIHRTSMLAQNQGHHVIIANHRGCGEGAGLAKGPYHSGRAEDVSAVLGWARQQYPNHLHVAIGFSMSANALLLLCSGQRGQNLPDRAIALNGPIDLMKASQKLREGFNKVYNFDLYRGCRRDAFIAQHEHLKNVRIPRMTSIYEFDRLYTAPTGGFKSREDYYQTCSTVDKLSNIQIPAVILTAKDDPFIDFGSYEQARYSSSTIFHAENSGGHMGYISREKTPLGTYRWQDYAINEALKQLC